MKRPAYQPTKICCTFLFGIKFVLFFLNIFSFGCWCNFPYEVGGGTKLDVWGGSVSLAKGCRGRGEAGIQLLHLIEQGKNFMS